MQEKNHKMLIFNTFLVSKVIFLDNCVFLVSANRWRIISSVFCRTFSNR